MFKRWTALLSALLFFFCFYALYTAKVPVFSDYAEEFEVYTVLGSFGSGKTCTLRDFARISGVKGESCAVTVGYLQVICDFNAKHIFTETTDAGESYYAYSPEIPYRINIGGATVNIHYFNGADGSKKLGTPIIFGSY